MSEASTSPHLLSNASWYLLEKMVRLAGAFLIGAWVARHLGPDDYGALAYALALIATLGFLGSWGVESLVVRDLSQGSLDRQQVVSTYFFVKLGGAALVPVLAASYLTISHPHDERLMWLALVCSGTVLLGAFDVADCWLQARQQARTTSLIRLMGFIAGALLRCSLVILGAPVVWFAVAVLVEALLIACLYGRLMQQHQLLPRWKACHPDEFKRLLQDGKMMALSGLTVAIYSKVDVLAMGALLPTEVLGPYAMAASMCAAWNMVGMSLVQAWAPRISQAFQGGREMYLSWLRRMLWVMLGVSVAGSAVLSLCASWIFELLLGSAYASGVPVFAVMIWSAVPVFLGVATSQIIVNEKIYWVSMLRTTLGVTVSLAAIAPVASTWGGVGVASLVVLSAAVATSGILFSSAARTTLARVFFHS